MVLISECVAFWVGHSAKGAKEGLHSPGRSWAPEAFIIAMHCLCQLHNVSVGIRVDKNGNIHNLFLFTFSSLHLLWSIFSEALFNCERVMCCFDRKIKQSNYNSVSVSAYNEDACSHMYIACGKAMPNGRYFDKSFVDG